MTFVPPKFHDAPLEIRALDKEVQIYGKPAGLRQLARILLDVADGSEASGAVHVHVNDLDLVSKCGDFIELVVVGMSGREESTLGRGWPRRD